jgi:hypothetical protein
MSPAPRPPGRSPPTWPLLKTYSPRPDILPSAPCASRSFVLAAARLRALHLDSHRHSTAQDQLPRRETAALATAPVFIESSYSLCAAGC